MAPQYPNIGPDDDTKDFTAADRQAAVVGAAYVIVQSIILHLGDLLVYGLEEDQARIDKRWLALRLSKDVASKLRPGLFEEPKSKKHTPIISASNASAETEQRCITEICQRLFRLLSMMDVERKLGESPLFRYLNHSDVSAVVHVIVSED